MPAADTSSKFNPGQFAAVKLVAYVLGSPNLFGHVDVTDLLDGIAGAIPEEVTGTTYTCVANDVGKIKDLSNAAGCAVTIPDGVFADFTTLVFTSQFAGSTIVAGGATTFRIPGGGGAPVNFQEVNSLVQAKNMGGDNWLLVGGVEGTI